MNYDIIGDVHGCFDELNELVEKLGYTGRRRSRGSERKLLFLGDLVDRGPDSNLVLRLVMDLKQSGLAESVMGNHCWRLMHALQGKKVKRSKTLRSTIEQIKKSGKNFCQAVLAFLENTPITIEHGDDLLAVHGATKEGVKAARRKELALYGELSDEVDKWGHPVRLENWARRYRGPFRTIVRGHTVVDEVQVLVSAGGTNVYNLDTGCVYGGKLTALRYPEMRVVQVAARRSYSKYE